jgi:hypothetical protein
MRGLARPPKPWRRPDPRIHPALQTSFSFLMDGRVKPGHDERVVIRYNGRQ